MTYLVPRENLLDSQNNPDVHQSSDLSICLDKNQNSTNNLRNLKAKNLSRIIVGQAHIVPIRNKFELRCSIIKENMDIAMFSEASHNEKEIQSSFA